MTIYTITILEKPDHAPATLIELISAKSPAWATFYANVYINFNALDVISEEKPTPENRFWFIAPPQLVEKPPTAPPQEEVNPENLTDLVNDLIQRKQNTPNF